MNSGSRVQTAVPKVLAAEPRRRPGEAERGSGLANSNSGGQKGEGSERRRVPRRDFNTEVGVLAGGEYSVERTFQLGEGGIMVSSQKALQIGRLLVVSFFLNSHLNIVVRAIVRSMLPADNEHPQRYGLEFQNLEFQYKREIRNFVASTSPVAYQSQT
ncbi:MAG: PilZ domain-containing protein [Bdellovibrionales bacterium]